MQKMNEKIQKKIKSENCSPSKNDISLDDFSCSEFPKEQTELNLVVTNEAVTHLAHSKNFKQIFLID